jgi:hypothetical protein
MFQCVETECGKFFGWSAKKIVKQSNTVTMEYQVCPHCGGLRYEELPRDYKPPKAKETPPVQMPTAVEAFDPEDLMKHQGWKNKKRREEGQTGYTTGSLNWGWDFEDKFNPSTIEFLKKGPHTIDKYEFSYNAEYHTVRVKVPK